MSMTTSRIALAASLLLAAMLVLVACSGKLRPAGVPVHGWWVERGPVVPHDSFPADCSLCHTGESWNKLRDDFSFDHAAETEVALVGAAR